MARHLGKVLQHRRPRPFEVTQSVCAPGGRDNRGLNEDLVGWSDDAVWVLDGATGLRAVSLLETASDARWFVQRFDKALRSQLRRTSTSSSSDSRELLRTAIAKVSVAFARQATRQPIAKYEVPSASMSFLRVRGRSMECALLGDCRLLYAASDGTFFNLFGSAALEELDRRAIGVLRRMKRVPLLAESLWSLFGTRLLRSNRARMNDADGYWTLSLDTAAADHMEYRTITTAEGDQALLVSDGFYRLVDTFQVFSDRTLVRAAAEVGLDILYDQLRTLEAADVECRQYPRFKPSDDASAVLIAFR